MSQTNAASAKPSETKNDEENAAAPASTANNKSNKFLQLDTQKLKLVSDTVKVSMLKEISVMVSVLKTSLFRLIFSEIPKMN